jgi:phosphoglycolate phosphatase
MKFNAVLFDLDGTLLDTLEDLADSMNNVLNRFGFPGHAVEAYKYFVGDGMENLARRALPENHRDEATVARCVAAMREEYGTRWAEKTHPYQGIPELLDALTARGIKMAVLSNKPDDFTKVIVTRLLPHWRFELVVGARPSMPKKPDPAAAVELAERLGIPPRGFLYLGDTNTDMQTAGAAGMYPVGVLWGFRTADELTASGAKVLIEHPTDLLELL